MFDRQGDIRQVGLGVQGIYHEGTRFLSKLELRLGKHRPLLLSSTVKDDNALLAVDLTNPDSYANGQVVIPHGTVHISRTMFIWEGRCYEKLRLLNYGVFPISFCFSLLFEADFADIFEARGSKRPQRGERLPDFAEGGYCPELSGPGRPDTSDASRVLPPAEGAFVEGGSARSEPAAQSRADVVSHHFL